MAIPSSGDPDELLAQLSWVRALARELVRDVHLADDVTQEAAAAALAGGPRDPRALGAWLRGVVRRLAARSFREHERRARRELAAAASEAQPATVDVVARLALHRRIVDAVEALDEPYRSAILLRFFDELPPRAIAQRLDVPVKTVQTRLTRGLEKLRARLQREFGGERESFARALAPLLATGAVIVGTKAKLALAAAGIAVVAGLGWWVPQFLRDRSPRIDAPPPPLASAVTVTDHDRAPAPVEVTRAPEAAAPEKAKTAAPSTALEPLRVHVVDPGGNSLAGARVKLVRREGNELHSLDFEDFARETVVHEATTDGAGIVAFDALHGRAYDVRANATPGLFATTRNHYSGETVELALARAATVRGRVTTTGGASVADAHVLLSNAEFYSAGRAATADSTGEFTIDELGAGKWWLTVQSPSGNSTDGVELDLAPGVERRADLVVGSGALLHGRVTDAATGAPIAGAELCFGLSSRFRLRADANGEYRWPGFTTKAFLPLVVHARGYGRSERWLRNVTSGDVVQDFTLTVGRHARGRVVDAGGAPLADVYVAALAQEMTVDGAKLDAVSTRTRADGSFELGELRRGLLHALILRRDGFATLIFALADGDPDGDRLELGDFTLATGAAIDGRVVDAAGAPLAGVAVGLTGFNEDWARFRPAGEREPPMSVVVYGSRPECTSGADGAFHFANLPAGRFEASATRGRRETPVSAKVELASGELHAGVELRFVPRFAITGRVVDPDGHALPNSSLDAWPETPLTGERSQAVALEDGRFELGGLDAGSYTVTVQYDGARFHDAGRAFLPTKREHVAAGTSDVLITLAEGVRLRGIVNDHDGKPVERAVITLLVAGAAPVGRWSTADGHFEFVVPPETSATLEVRRLPPDATDRDIEAIAKSPPLAVVRDVVAEDGEITVELPSPRR